VRRATLDTERDEGVWWRLVGWRHGPQQGRMQRMVTNAGEESGDRTRTRTRPTRSTANGVAVEGAGARLTHGGRLGRVKTVKDVPWTEAGPVRPTAIPNASARRNHGGGRKVECAHPIGHVEQLKLIEGGGDNRPSV
jgi:hypothetical protein